MYIESHYACDNPGCPGKRPASKAGVISADPGGRWFTVVVINKYGSRSWDFCSAECIKKNIDTLPGIHERGNDAGRNI